MAETIDEITYDYEDEGRQVRRELKREVLSKGAWSTIMFYYQELDRKTDEWRAPKIAIVRYKKWNGQYRKQSGFNISSEKQARAIVAAIEKWYSADGEDSANAPAEEAAAKPKKKATKNKATKNKATKNKATKNKPADDTAAAEK